MQKPLWYKIAAIAGVILLLQMPLFWVKSAVKERQYYNEQVSQDIANSWSGAQHVVGPFLVVPYQVEYELEIWDKNLEAYVTKKKTERHKRIIVPTANHFSSRVDVEKRYRGIYGAPVYRTMLDIKGELDVSTVKDVANIDNVISVGQPYLTTFVSDLRGVSDIPRLQYNERQVDFTEGAMMNIDQPGLHAKLDLEGLTTLDYRFTLPLRGSIALDFYPVGKNNEVNITSAWPHPKFKGDFLPDAHTITEEGFSVTWKLNALSSNLLELIDECASGDCEELLSAGFGIDLIEPVSTYTLSDRATKYALLFVLLTFCAFFIFEIIKGLLIHPLQYLMVGLSLSVFYLLLVGLSEHLSFALAYFLSAIACIGLIACYTSYILAGWLRGLMIGGALGLIYTLLFFILRSEDYAFVMGSILMFAVLSTVMFATRKLDWYALGNELAATNHKGGES